MEDGVDVLIPTINRPHALIICLTAVAQQSLRRLNIIVAEQSTASIAELPEVLALQRIICSRGGSWRWFKREQKHGIAEQRNFLLGKARSRAVLFLDDDVFMETNVVRRLERTLFHHGCGFVGAFPAGLSFAADVRPQQQHVEFWNGKVRPEAVEVGSAEWERAQLHRAANIWHLERRLKPEKPIAYKVAWSACCTLYDRHKLEEVGGFSFWHRLPRFHSGEDVLVQNLLMRRWGGCALLPSGTFHIELPSTVLNEAGSVDGHALDLLPELVERFAPPHAPANREASRPAELSDL